MVLPERVYKDLHDVKRSALLELLHSFCSVSRPAEK